MQSINMRALFIVLSTFVVTTCIGQIAYSIMKTASNNLCTTASRSWNPLMQQNKVETGNL